LQNLISIPLNNRHTSHSNTNNNNYHNYNNNFNKCIVNNLSVNTLKINILTLNCTYYAIPDTGIMGKYLVMDILLENIKITSNSSIVILPDNSTITATHEEMLIIP